MTPGKLAEMLTAISKGDDLTTKDRVEFAKDMSFEEFLKWAATTYSVEYAGPHDVSRVISTFYKKIERGFEKLGFDASKSVYLNIKNNGDEKRAEEINVTKKKEFNTNLNEKIRNSSRYKQVTNDYDILGTATLITEEEYRNTYRQCGKNTIDAFSEMIGNGGDAEIALRIIEKDGRPHAIRSAKKLMDAGVAVYNYDEGEKFGAGMTWSKNANVWPSYVKTVIIGASDLRDLSEDTGIPQVTLKELAKDREPTYKEMLVIYKKGQEKDPSLPKPYEEKPWAFFICRDFFKDEKTQCEEPQMHKKFTGVIIDGWDKAAQWIFDYIDAHKGPSFTKEQLKKYL